MLNNPKLWFGPKKGWGEGLRPLTWEGWALTAGVSTVAITVTLTAYLS
jgi:hypothetical protein